MNKDLFIKMFSTNDANIASEIYEQEGLPNNIKYSLKDYYKVFEKKLDDNILNTTAFIPPNVGQHKQIIRQLLDFGYMELIEDDEETSDIINTCRLLLSDGFYCILAEYFASACCISQKFVQYCVEDQPDFIQYIKKYKKKDINLEYMLGLI